MTTALAYLIADTSHDGRTVYFDGFGFTLLRPNAKTMDSVHAVAQRSLICGQFPSCLIVPA